MKKFFLFLLIIAIALAATLRVRYGGGEPYTDVSTDPLIDESALEEFFAYPDPIGNVAVSHDGRVFFTVHPESRPQGNRLLEIVAGAAMPYPDGASQPTLFNTVLGLVIDRRNILWTIDHGNHGFGEARLLAFDLASGEVVLDHRFGDDIAPAGSFLQDVQVSPDGRTVVIADASIWRKTPALIVFDIQQQAARRILESHESVSPENYLIRNPLKNMSFLGGLVSLKGGVDGIAFDTSGEWLYFAAINQSGLYRVRLEDLTDTELPPEQLDNRVERFCNKPLSDGLSTDLAGNVYITDVEHSSVFLVGPDKLPQTLVRSDRIRWADALSFGPDGWLYLADSAIPEQILKTKDYIMAKGPYHIFRFQPGFEGIPGR
ncbi:MAG: L-dopachrome tautomerase-related protein [Woeseiaceae bacterium]